MGKSRQNILFTELLSLFRAPSHQKRDFSENEKTEAISLLSGLKDINKRNWLGNTLLHQMAGIHGDNALAVCEVLMQKGANPNIQAEGCRTPPISALYSCNLPMFCKILEPSFSKMGLGINIEFTNERRIARLHSYAVVESNQDTVSYDPLLCDDRDRTVSDILRQEISIFWAPQEYFAQMARDMLRKPPEVFSPAHIFQQYSLYERRCREQRIRWRPQV